MSREEKLVLSGNAKDLPKLAKEHPGPVIELCKQCGADKANYLEMLHEECLHGHGKEE